MTHHTTSTAHAEKLAKVTEAIVKAVPDIVTLYCLACEEDVPNGAEAIHEKHPDAVSEYYEPHITLEDVLRVIFAQEPQWKIMKTLAIHGAIATLLRQWHLGKPLDQQSEETIDFLHSLLCS